MQAVELSFRPVGEQRGRAFDSEECAAGDLSGRRRRRTNSVAVDEGSRRGRHRGHVGARGTGSAAYLSMSDALTPVGVADDDGHGGVGIVHEVAAQLVADLMSRGRLRQHAIVWESPSHAQERRTEQNQQSDTRQPERNCFVHNATRGAVPESSLDGPGLRFGAAEYAADEPAHVERVQAIAEQNQCRGRHDDRSSRREGDGRDARVGERLQEVHREQHKNRHRKGDRRGREHHGAARRHHRPHQGFVAARPFGQLVAEPADHQQGVVDRQGKAHRGGEVEGEDRHVGDKRDQSQHSESAEDCDDADADRQRCGHQAAERPDEHQKTQRDRQRLHHQQVALRLLGDLDVDHRGSARPDGDAAVVVRHLVGQLSGVLLLLALVAGDTCDDESRRAVAADQIRGGGRRRGPWRAHLCDMWRTAQLVDDLVARGASSSAVDTVGCRDDDQ